MTEVNVTKTYTTVEVIKPNTATINVTGTNTATINQNVATIAQHLTNVDAIESPAYIQWNTSAVATGGVGRIIWNDTDGTLEFQMKGGNVTQKIGMEQFIHVKANDSGGLTKGKVVYAVGSDGTNIKVAYATASSETTSSKTLAVIAETVTGGNKAYGVTFGLVTGFNTNALTEGNAVWLSPTGTGNLTSTRPTPPDHAVFIGYCLRQNSNNGVLFVNIQNGYEIEELHDVLITNKQNLDVLQYDSASGLWKNSQVVGPAGPQGPQGEPGTSATVTAGTTTTGNAGTDASVTNSGTSSNAIFDFTIPRGDKGDTGDPGEPGAKGDPGDPGTAATITVGTTTTGSPGSDASVTNSGTSSAAIFDFDIPRGDKGDTGDTGPAGSAGAAATIAVGTTTTGSAGSTAIVSNSGTSSAAIFDFTIPRGDKGDKGDTGNTGATGPAGADAPVLIIRHAWASPYDYVGTAPQGTAESSPGWTLTRIQVANDGTTTVKHASDSWNNRVTAVYS